MEDSVSMQADPGPRQSQVVGGDVFKKEGPPRSRGCQEGEELNQQEWERGPGGGGGRRPGLSLFCRLSHHLLLPASQL